MLSDKVGGVTGVGNAFRTALSHPSLPRATTPQQLTELDRLGDWPQSIPVQSLPIPKAQPRLSTDTGLLTTVTYRSGRLVKTPQVQVGGFSNAVLLADLDPTGLTSKRHHGTDATEFGDGFGNGGGRVVLPVRIIWKPKPTYTDEARSQKIEGEVIVDVMFHANGCPEVLGIVKRLGYGLDDIAVNSVQRIKFRPASVNGEAVDFEGRAHVEFSLSNGDVPLTVKPAGDQSAAQATSANGDREGFGVYAVKSTPNNADTFVNDIFVGMTPLKLKLPPGNVKLKIAFSGFKPWERTLRVFAGSTANIDAMLDKE